MRVIILILSITLSTIYCAGQNGDGSDKLRVVRLYAVQTSSEEGAGKKEYYVDGKPATRSEYNKYKFDHDALAKCTPCVLEYQDINDNVTQRFLAYTDCPIGWCKVYFPSGQLKIDGQYANLMDQPQSPNGPQSCSVSHGKWTFYNEKGDSIYSEYWNMGGFVKQVPEQPTNELLDADILLNDSKPSSGQVIAPSDLNRLEFKLQSKNSAPFKGLKYQFQFGSEKGGAQNINIDPNEYPTYNFDDILKKLKAKKAKSANVYVNVLFKDRTYASAYFVINL